MVNSNYNPDVLNCIANLSNDEVFTPPELANRVLDLLPQDLFKSPDTKFLDPFSKSGVFLREIVKRLDFLSEKVKLLEHNYARQVADCVEMRIFYPVKIILKRKRLITGCFRVAATDLREMVILLMLLLRLFSGHFRRSLRLPMTE